MKWAVIVLGLAGCRLSINKWGGTPPRASDHIKIALHDNGGGALAEQVLKADSRVEVIAFDPAVNEKQRTDCGNLACPLALEPACRWAAQQGADYYAIAAQRSAFSQTTKCVRSHTDWSKAFDKSGDSEVCDESAVTAEGTQSSFSIRLYDVATCEEVPTLSQQVTSYVPGTKEESEVAASMQVRQLAPTKYPGFPEQASVAPDGHIVNAPDDGEYALFHAREFAGIARIDHAGTADERARMLMCCEQPRPGDVLVKRGAMRFWELAASFDAGTVWVASGAVGSLRPRNRGLLGAGLHLRRYALAGGLQLGGSAEIIGAGSDTQDNDIAVGLLSIDAGWAYHLAPPLHVSANLGAGVANISRDVDADTRQSAWTPYVMPQVRAQVAVRWWYVALDLGFAMSRTIGISDWSVSAGMPAEARLRGPVARLYAGITL